MPLKYLEKHSDIFVETGTLTGDGVLKALEVGYNKIYSIELEDRFYQISKYRFSNCDNVKLFKGDSGLMLSEMIKDTFEQITFWLDGHYSGEGTGFGLKEMPILEELAQIKRHPIKNHIIMIDDVRCWKNYNAALNFDTVISTIKSINNDYEFYFMEGDLSRQPEDDILLAKIK